MNKFISITIGINTLTFFALLYLQYYVVYFVDTQARSNFELSLLSMVALTAFVLLINTLLVGLAVKK